MFKKYDFDKLYLYTFMFFLFCVFGWVYEVVLEFIYGHGFVNRGFLFGPYLPIYGFGALVLISVLKEIMKKKWKAGLLPLAPLLVFILVVIITTAIEYISGFALEAIFHKRWWDYSTDFMNINGYVCPRTSFNFGIGGMFFLYVCMPAFRKLFGKIPKKHRKYFAVAILTVIAVDFLLTIVRTYIHS